MPRLGGGGGGLRVGWFRSKVYGLGFRLKVQGLRFKVQGSGSGRRV